MRETSRSQHVRKKRSGIESRLKENSSISVTTISPIAIEFCLSFVQVIVTKVTVNTLDHID